MSSARLWCYVLEILESVHFRPMWAVGSSESIKNDNNKAYLWWKRMPWTFEQTWTWTTFTKLVGAMGEIQLTVSWANGHIGALAQLLVVHQEYSLALVTELLPRGVVVHVCILSQEQDPAYRSVVSMGKFTKWSMSLSRWVCRKLLPR